MTASDIAKADTLAAWLRAVTDADDVRVVRFERLRGGAIQDNYLLDVDVRGGGWHGRHSWVLRTNARSGVDASETRASEYEVLRIAHAAGVRAPTPLLLCTDPAVIGSEFFIMERLPGVAAGHRVTRETALAPDPAALAYELGANLARIHAIRPPPRASGANGKGGLEPPRPAAPGASQGNPALVAIATYRAWVDRLDDAYPILEWGLRRCERHAPATYEVAFVHRDYRTGNYLVDNGRLAGVLDWEFAGWGDPREDLGWFTARCWRFARRDLEAGGIAPLEPFVAGYASVAGHGISRADLDYWQTMAHLRWAIIALQQAQRHRRERSLELALTGRIVDELEYEVLELTKGSA
ncbi:MAG TPA: phosphotransferase family protein [Casimicrobiaceae bacterium]|nr:phosphotransferase family protein [Casimicrobiaceae bacterium]